MVIVVVVFNFPLFLSLVEALLAVLMKYLRIKKTFLPELVKSEKRFFRTRGTRKPFGQTRTTRAPSVSTASTSDNEIDAKDVDNKDNNVVGDNDGILFSNSLDRFVTNSCSFRILWMSRSKLFEVSVGLIRFERKS